MASSSENNVAYCLLAEFDIDQGSTLSHQYPFPTGTDDHLLADLMIPEGAHDQHEDWTIFFLNQTPANTIAPPLDSEAPTPPLRSREFGAPAEPEEDKPELLYVLNLVRTKKDDTVPRGALVKALAVCTRHPFVQIYKPVLLLALEDYFAAPSVAVLARLYDAINAMDLSLLPRLSHAEKLILRASDKQDMFIEKFFGPPRPAGEDGQRERADSSASAKERERLANFDLAMSARDAPSKDTPGTPQDGRRIPKDTHFFETIIEYEKQDHKSMVIPIRIPLAHFPEEIGDYSLVNLIQTFSAHPAPTYPLHPHLHSNGALTHPITLLFNALVTEKRVVFLGYGKPAALVSNFVLAACALASGSGAVLRGFAERAFPYTCLKDLDNFLSIPGYIAGVTNPRFEDNHAWWDVLVNINTGRITISSQIRPSPNLASSSSSTYSHSHSHAPQSPPPAHGIPNSASNTSLTLSASSAQFASSTGAMSSEDDVGRIPPPPPPSSHGTSSAPPPSASQRSDIASRDSPDNLFMDEILAAIAGHYGEQHIRARFSDLAVSFVRMAARYEEETLGSTSIGHPSQPYLNNQLGSGTVFADDSTRARELAANAHRVEAWRATKSYRNFRADWQHHAGTRAICDIDVLYQIQRLRTAKNMPEPEAALIFRSLADRVDTYPQVAELLSQLPPQQDGLVPLGFGLFHPRESVREATLELFIKLQAYPLGIVQLSTLNTFHRLAFVRLMDQRFGPGVWSQQHQGSASASAPEHEDDGPPAGSAQ